MPCKRNWSVRRGSINAVQSVLVDGVFDTVCNQRSWQRKTSKYPWVAEAWSIEEKYVAIGPNPARLANLCRGVELSSANCTNISRATEQTFLEMVPLTREFMPTSFKVTFECGLLIESADVSERLLSGQILQLNSCKLLQVLLAWFSGYIV